MTRMKKVFEKINAIAVMGKGSLKNEERKIIKWD